LRKDQEIKKESELLSTRVYGGIGIPADSLVNVIRVLEHLRSQLNAWKTKPPPDLNEFEISASYILKTERFLTEFESDYSGLVLEVKDLRYNLADLKIKYSNLEIKCSNLDDRLIKEIASREQLEDRLMKEISSREQLQYESEKQKSIIRVFDLISMYRFYVLEKIVGGNWGRFCEEYNAFQDDVDDKIRSQHDFDAFLKPFDDQLADGLTISLIMDTIEERHEIAHSDIRSAKKQKAFLEECLRIDFVDTKSKFIASKILPQFENIALKRIT
jgi:hypothetical protein